MEITNFKKGKSNIYEITIDYKDTYNLYDDIILKYELLIDKSLNPSKLKTILNENEKMEAYYKALKYLGIKMRSELEIKKYLKKYEINESSINYAIDKLKSEGYIDAERYAKSFISDQLTLTLNGPKKIKEDLKKVGTPENIIISFLENIDDSTWHERITKIIDKKAKVNKNSLSLFKNKTYSNLIMMGYESTMINSILDNYKLDTSESFKKDANKIWNQVTKKYDGSDRVLQFKNKMYQKGYTIDEINSYVHSIDT